eukprot:6213025-Pleurochrysis_carterae.AAC.8
MKSQLQLPSSRGLPQLGLDKSMRALCWLFGLRTLGEIIEETHNSEIDSNELLSRFVKVWILARFVKTSV